MFIFSAEGKEETRWGLEDQTLSELTFSCAGTFCSGFLELEKAPRHDLRIKGATMFFRDGELDESEYGTYGC